MRGYKSLLLASAMTLAPTGVVIAQSSTPSAPPQAETSPCPSQPPANSQEGQEKATAVEEVTVRARSSDVRTSIDSISYSVADDLQSTSGSLADALRNVPSVDVDPDGNVTLRGDGNVAILVDGRPSSLFSGPGRGQAVSQTSADQYARIEVMANPSAAYRPDGSGGVINLITKPVRVRQGETTSGSVRANVGNDGRYNFGGNVAHLRGNLTLSGDLSLRNDAFIQDVQRLRERLDALSGLFLPARQSQRMDWEADSAFARITAEYRLSDKTQIVGELRHYMADNGGPAEDLYETDDATGGVASAYHQVSLGSYVGQSTGATGRVAHSFDDQGHDWTSELRLDQGRNTYAHQGYIDRRIPTAPNALEEVEILTETDSVGLTSAYVRPLVGDAKLRAGYELDAQSLRLDNRVSRGTAPTGLSPDPLISNIFHADQAVHALYATYERPFGSLTAQLGLRLEQADIDLDQVTTGAKTSNTYFRAYPTLHLSYALAEGQTLRASYSRRVQRPDVSDLNPFVTYVDPRSYRSGNPDLEPQTTDSFELGWMRRADQSFYQATFYHRDTRKAFTTVVRDYGGDFFLTRTENLGAAATTGLELTAVGRLHPTLRYNASLNAYRQSLTPGGIVGGVDRSGSTISGRLSLSWQPTTADFLQLTGVWTGDQLQAQGVRESATLVNLGYRSRLTEKLALQMTVRNVFDNYSDVVVTDTTTFRERTERFRGGRFAYIGLTWSFGGSRTRPEQFDFSAPI